MRSIFGPFKPSRRRAETGNHWVYRCPTMGALLHQEAYLDSMGLLRPQHGAKAGSQERRDSTVAPTLKPPGLAAWRDTNSRKIIAAIIIAAMAAAFMVLLVNAAAAAPVLTGRQVDCLALAVYREARGELLQGQIAVAYVVVNRGPDPCATIERRGQFVWPKRLPVGDRESWRHCVAVARLVAARRIKDPTEGATFFHEVTIRPRWANAMTPTAVLGGHVFFVREGK